jgi:DNA-binding CsgD family transcriptional regulator
MTGTDLLSPREEEVLCHLVEGLTYAAIARRMGLSVHTVDTYLRRIRRKTSACNTAQLVMLAVRRQAVRIPEAVC